MKYLIGDTVINSDQIVGVLYIPAQSGVDDETGEPYNRKSRVTITTTAIERDVQEGYDGRIAGVGSRSQEIYFRGNMADRFWQVYSADALDVLKVEA